MHLMPLLSGMFLLHCESVSVVNQRQDLLRVLFRFLDLVVQHPACKTMVPIMVEQVLYLFTKRINEKSERNFRIVAVILQQIKHNSETLLRRGEDHLGGKPQVSSRYFEP